MRGRSFLGHRRTQNSTSEYDRPLTRVRSPAHDADHLDKRNKFRYTRLPPSGTAVGSRESTRRPGCCWPDGRATHREMCSTMFPERGANPMKRNETPSTAHPAATRRTEKHTSKT